MFRDGTMDECLQRDAAYGAIRCGDFKGSMARLSSGLYFAMVFDWFVVSGPAKAFAFRFLVKPDSSVLQKAIAVSGCMVIPMVIIMSFYGGVEACIKAENGEAYF